MPRDRMDSHAVKENASTVIVRTPRQKLKPQSGQTDFTSLRWKGVVTNKLLNCLKTRVAWRFLSVFLVISLLPLLFMRWLAIRKVETAIQNQTFSVLRAASDGAE